MANITGKKTIFFVTSPRSPYKLTDEIRFLAENFSGRVWNSETQKEFYLKLAEQPFFEGTKTGDIAFKARDRINRAPKSLGLIDLKPTVQLTEAGKRFVYGKRPEEAFLRQLLKFQLSSPYHIDSQNTFRVKPYLELMRLIHDFGSLSKNEIALFVVQLTDYKNYESIKQKIESFRKESATLRERKISYKKFVLDCFVNELTKLFEQEINSNELGTRQSEDVSLENFIKTKRHNHIDYADAAIRYLRATGLFSLKPKTFKIYPIAEKVKDLEYLLTNSERDTKHYETEESYENEYLFDPDKPALLTDDKQLLIEKILAKSKDQTEENTQNQTVEQLKDLYYELVTEGVSNFVEQEKEKLRTYQEYDDILKTFSDIEKKDIADPPLFFEWNIWRAFAMLNDGDISGNFKIDDDGVPLYTAPGNVPDIVCKYKDFETIVEVTMSSGHKQYEMEGEPVARHYGNFKRNTDKEVYCVFIAPQLSQATVAYYYSLYRMNIDYYGGQAKIIPISLNDFKKLLSSAYSSSEKPNASAIRNLFKELADLAISAKSETEWHAAISSRLETAF